MCAKNCFFCIPYSNRQRTHNQQSLHNDALLLMLRTDIKLLKELLLQSMNNQPSTIITTEFSCCSGQTENQNHTCQLDITD